MISPYISVFGFVHLYKSKNRRKIGVPAVVWPSIRFKQETYAFLRPLTANKSSCQPLTPL